MHLGSGASRAPRQQVAVQNAGAPTRESVCAQPSPHVPKDASFSLERNGRLWGDVSPKGTSNPFCGQNQDLTRRRPK